MFDQDAYSRYHMVRAGRRWWTKIQYVVMPRLIIRSPYCLLIEFSFPPSSYHVIAMYEHDQFIFPSAMRFAHSAAVHSHPHCQHTCLITVPTSSSVTAVFPSMAPPDPGLAAIFFIRLREKRPRGPARFNPESIVRTSAFVISIISWTETKETLQLTSHDLSSIVFTPSAFVEPQIPLHPPSGIAFPDPATLLPVL